MKVVVTGANGQVGQALQATKPPECNCVALNRLELDLSDQVAIESTIEELHPDIVINAGAYTMVDRAEDEEELATLVNGTAVSVLSQVTRRIGCHLVHVSSDFVFDGSLTTAYPPHAPPNPISAYGRSKVAGEIAAGPGASIIRSSWIYEAGGVNFVRTMLRHLREREEVYVVCDQIGAPTWATGLAEILWKFALLRSPGLFHHRDAGVASWYDFAVAISEEARVLGLIERDIPVIPVKTSDYPTPARRPAFSVLDDTPTRAMLGDQPPHWRVNLRRMLKREKKLG